MADSRCSLLRNEFIQDSCFPSRLVLRCRSLQALASSSMLFRSPPPLLGSSRSEATIPPSVTLSLRQFGCLTFTKGRAIIARDVHYVF